MSSKRRSTNLIAVLLRGTLALLLGIGGAILGEYLLAAGTLIGPANVAYLALVGLLTGWLLAARPARWGARRIGRLADRLRTLPPDAVLAGTIGATVALTLTVLLDSVLANLPGMTWGVSVLLATVLTTAFIAFFVANRRVLPLPRSTTSMENGDPTSRRYVLDTSAIIDGRLVDVTEANFLTGRLLIPAFVLQELQAIADDGDTMRRRRGRRGLEVLERLGELRTVETEVLRGEEAQGATVDDKLVDLALRLGSDLVTTDFNLHQVASLQGVRVLNLNRLAAAMKASHLPGETLTVQVQRPGKEAGQGLAYLDDGTMIVVEDAADRLGETLPVIVTSTLQTNVGRMVFAKPGDPGNPDA